MNTYVAITNNHRQTVQKLIHHQIPFQEIVVQTCEGSRPAIALSTNALILIAAGRWLSDDYYDPHHYGGVN